ncbi:hypothetical protein C6560_06770 [Enterobacter sp. FS01]|nr:hypothetical protein C6560_06770 [Enterobacter sp. FS01]
MAILVRRALKVAFYLFLSVCVGRTLGSPEIWMNHSIAQWIGHLLYGPGEIGADNFYDLYFYISIITVFPITTVLYILTMKLIKRIRSL